MVAYKSIQDKKRKQKCLIFKIDFGKVYERMNRKCLQSYDQVEQGLHGKICQPVTNLKGLKKMRGQNTPSVNFLMKLFHIYSFTVALSRLLGLQYSKQQAQNDFIQLISKNFFSNGEFKILWIKNSNCGIWCC